MVIITGANTGIGKETAIDLAKRGGKIYMACRDISRGEAALQEVRELSGSKSVFYMQLDLASMESIRHFSQKYVIVIILFKCVMMSCKFTSLICFLLFNFIH